MQTTSAAAHVRFGGRACVTRVDEDGNVLDEADVNRCSITATTIFLHKLINCDPSCTCVLLSNRLVFSCAAGQSLPT